MVCLLAFCLSLPTISPSVTHLSLIYSSCSGPEAATRKTWRPGASHEGLRRRPRAGSFVPSALQGVPGRGAVSVPFLAAPADTEASGDSGKGFRDGGGGCGGGDHEARCFFCSLQSLCREGCGVHGQEQLAAREAAKLPLQGPSAPGRSLRGIRGEALEPGAPGGDARTQARSHPCFVHGGGRILVSVPLRSPPVQASGQPLPGPAAIGRGDGD
mmetsp:Transcript_18748/g.38632  ORF Transcript_18748/g.38632 Transcript_18748/m.38632 type:complete len:214 (-) Transcript_18748:327-968(-)